MSASRWSETLIRAILNLTVRRLPEVPGNCLRTRPRVPSQVSVLALWPAR